jgi:hypothetical protein
MYESLGFLKESLQLPTYLAQELIEMTIYCQLETVKMNGIESVYGAGSSYISVYETLDDFLDQKLLLEPSPISRRKLRRAALNVLGALPDHDGYWDALIHQDTLHCRIHWRSSDVLIHFV